MASEKRGAVRGNRETASEKAEQHVDTDRKKEGGWKDDWNVVERAERRSAFIMEIWLFRNIGVRRVGSGQVALRRVASHRFGSLRCGEVR